MKIFIAAKLKILQKIVNFYPSKLKSMVIINVLLVMLILSFSLNQIKLSNNDFLIRSGLFLPYKEFLMDRERLLQQIEDSFKHQEPGIQILTLVGTEGSGKTALARMYAQKQKFNVVWEINAEKKDSLISGFNDLAFALTTNIEQKKELDLIQIIQDAVRKEKAILNFVKRLLKQLPNWLLIYDNVENFMKIKDYFPQDTNTWGSGRVILTTCNPNVTQTSSIRDESVLLLGTAPHLLDQ